jgi:hypothetical protein
VKNSRGFIINEGFKYISNKTDTEEAGVVKIVVELPEDLKALESEVKESQFILSIEKKNLDVSIVGQYIVVIKYVFEGSNRNVL